MAITALCLNFLLILNGPPAKRHIHVKKKNYHLNKKTSISLIDDYQNKELLTYEYP